ncbi:MAG TPA: hypothetical protein VF773_06115 [Verrucomicrobiae bacterium]
MSLKFLAVGKSFAGLRGDKSPYALRKENQLPRFGSSRRFSGKAEEEPAMVQTDFLQQQVVSVAEGVISPMPEQAKEESLFAAAQQSTTPNIFAAQPQQKPAKRSWFSLFRWKWFRAQPSKADLVQSELSLEKVRVMRNDLADSDLRLVLKKKKKAKAVFSSHQENNGIARQGWSELSAKLFEIGQK